MNQLPVSDATHEYAIDPGDADLEDRYVLVRPRVADALGAHQLFRALLTHEQAAHESPISEQEAAANCGLYLRRNKLNFNPRLDRVLPIVLLVGPFVRWALPRLAARFELFLIRRVPPLGQAAEPRPRARGQVVGLIAAERQSAERIEVTWYLHPSCRGRGLAHRAVTAAMARMRARSPVDRFTAMIKPGNLASIRLAERLAFKKEALLAGAEGDRSRPALLFMRLIPPLD